jgi:glycerol-3-phosphate acyltransferase PlsY
MTWMIVIISYFLGAIPTAYIAGRILSGKDIRHMGDANSGAANVYRQLGPVPGIIVGIIDAAKGAAVILIAQAIRMPEPIVLAAGLAAVIGHNWPIFIGFRGGRGVSPTLGILLVLVTLPIIILSLPTLFVLVWRRNVTPAMAFLFISLPVLGLWMGISGILIIYGIGMAALVGLTHFFRTGNQAVKHA